MTKSVPDTIGGTKATATIVSVSKAACKPGTKITKLAIAPDVKIPK